MQESFNLWKWLGSVSNVVKVVLSFISLGVFITGIITLHDAKVIKKYNTDREIALTDTTTKLAIIKLDTLSGIVNRYILEQNKFNKSTRVILYGIRDTVSTVRIQLGNHIIKTTEDREDIKNWVNAFEKKNYNWIPSDESGLMSNQK